MTDAPKVGLALIARDEQNSLPQLLASIEGCFDYVAMVDTGSKDDTVDVFNQWALAEQERDPGFAAAWAPFTWCDDFAAARTRADALLDQWDDCAFHVWADCDDTLTHAAQLRPLAAAMPAELCAYVFSYAYQHDPHGNCVCTLKRERLVRRGHSRWEGRVHEAQVCDAPAMFIGADVCEWVHHPVGENRIPGRNLRILKRWLRDEPHNARVLGYIGTELLGHGQTGKALGYFRRCLKEPGGWDEERAQVHRKLARALIDEGKLADAEQSALRALTVMPQWPDSYLTLAEVAYHRRDWQKAGDWAKRVLELGVPDTLLIINPLEYDVAPKTIMAGCLGAMGRLESALQIAGEVLAEIPDHQEVAKAAASWQSQLKRQQVAQRAVEAAQLLVAHDEQAKALVHLEQCVPVFASDHPDVVAARSQLRERLRFVADPAAYAEHYTTGGSKPEDFMDDARALEVAEMLPRAHFLRAGLIDQAQELAA